MKDLRPAALALKLKLEEIDTQPDAKGLESAFQTAKQKEVGRNIHLPLSDKKQAGLEIVGLSCQCSVLVRSGWNNYFFNFSILLSFTASARKASSFSLASTSVTRHLHKRLTQRVNSSLPISLNYSGPFSMIR